MRMASSASGATSSSGDGSTNPTFEYRECAEICSASAIFFRTSAEGRYRPRSIWLRYGLETLARLASWRRDRFAI